jgi:hypothetical protein
MDACPKCGAETAVDQAFCESCGERLKDGAVRRRARGRREALAERQHRKHLRSARQAIMLVAVLTLLVGAFVYYGVSTELEKARRDPTVTVDEQAAARLKMFATVPLVVGAVFIGLFFWAKRNPFGAALTALVIYITDFIVTVALNPAFLTNVIAIVVKVIIVLALLQGVRSGLAFRRLKAAE